MQLSQQFSNENQSDGQEEMMQEEQSTEEEDSNQDSSSGHIQYQTIDTPVMASLSGPFYDSGNNATHNENIQERENSTNSTNTGNSGEELSSHDNVQYIVLPYAQNIRDTEGNSLYFAKSGSVGKNKMTKRNHPYERPSSPSLDVPQTLLALQQVATRLAANSEMRETSLSNDQS